MANQIILNKIPADARIVTIQAPANTTNGSIVTVGSFDTDAADYGTYAAAAPSAVTDLGMAMVLTPTLSYEAQYDENDFEISTGDKVRAYFPVVGMKVTIPVANITATATVEADNYVVPTTTVKPECKSSMGGTEAVAFLIDQVVTINGVSMAELRCIKA